ncbi:MAG: Gfo/Idh/MocA family oxidoreductase [Deinococcota bacterium]
MSVKPTVLVLGSGFAGQGHAQALSYAGADIVGMVSRIEAVVNKVAASLNIPYAGTDWDNALKELHPDIVAIATPGGAHVAPIMAALDRGCHVFCDKPLAATAQDAEKLYTRAKEVGAKTAFAASYRYMPYVSFAKTLIAQGVIGQPQEVECISHYNLDPLIPFGWSHRLAEGGGRLNNNFTHKLSIVLHMLNAEVRQIHGETRHDMRHAPVVSGVHDFRERRKFIPEDANQSNLDWAEVDAEWSYTVLATLDANATNAKLAEDNNHEGVSALFKHSGLQPRFHDDYIVIYGAEGAIHIQGSYAQGPLYVWTNKSKAWQQLELPRDIAEALPDIEDDTLRNWTCLAQAFVADILGKDTTPYQTFEDGWRYQEMIDAIRQDKTWRVT